jgi:hypothetical protein
MENQIKKPETKIDSTDEKVMREVGSNLTGTARPAMPDEKEFISHHLNKNAHHSKAQNTDAILGNVDTEARNIKQTKL